MVMQNDMSPMRQALIRALMQQPMNQAGGLGVLANLASPIAAAALAKRPWSQVNDRAVDLTRQEPFGQPTPLLPQGLYGGNLTQDPRFMLRRGPGGR